MPTPTTPPPKPHSVETALAVLTETVRNMDKKLDDLAQSKADKQEVHGILERVKSLEGDRGKIVWLIVGAVFAAILGMVVIKPGQPSSPQAQLTVPAIIQQAAPAPIQHPVPTK